MRPQSKLGGQAGDPTATGQFERFGQLKFHVVVEVADSGHAGALVDGSLDLGRDADVLNNEAAEFDAVLLGENRIEERQERVTQLGIPGCQVEHRHLGAGDRVAEGADKPRPHGVLELINAEVMIGASDVLEEHRDINDAEIVSTKGPNANDAEVRIPHHDGIARAPFVAGEEPGIDEVDIALEGRLEVVLPTQ